MPKVSWCRPKVNYLKVLITDRKRKKRMSYEDIAKKLGCSAQNVRQQVCRPAGKWKVEQILKYCDVLDIPYEDAMMAAIEK